MSVLSDNQINFGIEAIDAEFSETRGAIVLDPTRLKPALNKNATLSLDNVTLRPGNNYLKDLEVEALQKHPDYARYLAMGAISVIEPTQVVETVKVTTKQTQK